MRTHKGKFKVKNRNKYVGNADNVVYRSSWELSAFVRLDNDPSILQWVSEELVIPYVSPIDRRVHRYFPDIWCKKASGIYVIEIKPAYQTKPSIAKSKRKMISESVTYAVNTAKWNAAHAFCEKQGWKFQIMTENELFGKNG